MLGSVRIRLSAGTILLMILARAGAEPPATNPIPLDARGFAAGQALQQAYNRSLEEAAKPKPAPKAAAKPKTEDAAPAKSATAVVVASSPPGGNPPGTLRSLVPESRTAVSVASSPPGGSLSRATRDDGDAAKAPSAGNSFSDRVRGFFTRSGSATQAPPYLGK